MMGASVAVLASGCERHSYLAVEPPSAGGHRKTSDALPLWPRSVCRKPFSSKVGFAAQQTVSGAANARTSFARKWVARNAFAPSTSRPWRATVTKSHGGQSNTAAALPNVSGVVRLQIISLKKEAY
jgi:hypothetical protein